MLLLGTAIVFGLLGSLHCLGMCAPLLWAIPQREQAQKIWWRNRLLYNLGRAFTYAVLGALFGLLGESLSLMGWQQKISIGTGFLILLFLLTSKGVIPSSFSLKTLQKVIGRVRQGIGKHMQQQSAKAQLQLGLLNGLLPCGLVYMALLASVSMGSVLGGGLYMFIFGLGTLPMMIAAAFFGKKVKSQQPKFFNRLIPVFVGLIAILLIFRGLGLGIPYVSPASVSQVEMTLCISP